MIIIVLLLVIGFLTALYGSFLEVCMNEDIMLYEEIKKRHKEYIWNNYGKEV